MLVQTNRKFSAYCFSVPLVSENFHANQANGKALVNTSITTLVRLHPMHYRSAHMYCHSTPCYDKN